MNNASLHHMKAKISMLRTFFTLILSVFVFTSVYSQFDQSFFYADKYDQDLEPLHFQFHVDNLNYFRNTEYLNKVDVGSTYPGFHLLPYGQYQLNEHATVFGGLFMRYDFGNPQVKTIEPYIKFKYRLWEHELIMGNLEGNVQHQLIEPLMDYERAITHRPEQGIQVKLEDHRIEWDFWIDWQQMIYEGDPKNEKMFAGLTLGINPIMNDRSKLSLKGQAVTLHQAGELDSNSAPNSIEYNFAFGLSFEHQFTDEFSIYMSGHQAYYYDQSSRMNFGYRNGNGTLAVLRLQYGEYFLVANYWDAYRFQAPTGERLYQSQGRKNLGFPIHYRKNLMLRFANELPVAKNLTFMSRLGVNINLDHQQTDVIMENYLRWHIRSKPKKLILY
jgi:hypothetical protein